MNPVRVTEGVCPADICSDLSDVAIAIETGRVRVSRWCVVYVVDKCNPRQVTGQLCVDGRVVGALVQPEVLEIKVRTALS